MRRGFIILCQPLRVQHKPLPPCLCVALLLCLLRKLREDARQNKRGVRNRLSSSSLRRRDGHEQRTADSASTISCLSHSALRNPGESPYIMAILRKSQKVKVKVKVTSQQSTVKSKQSRVNSHELKISKSNSRSDLKFKK